MNDYIELVVATQQMLKEVDICEARRWFIFEAKFIKIFS